MLTAESAEEDETGRKEKTHGSATETDGGAAEAGADGRHGAEPSRADVDDDADAQPERRREGVLRPVSVALLAAPAHWAATNRGGDNRRRCLSCAPHTTPNGQRFCSQCERSENTREFGPNVNGQVQRVCRTCTATQGRLTFFIENSPRLSQQVVS